MIRRETWITCERCDGTGKTETKEGVFVECESCEGECRVLFVPDYDLPDDERDPFADEGAEQQTGEAKAGKGRET